METAKTRFGTALLVVFFVSGLSALIYQIVWLKYLGFVFGNSVYAASTLIAIYLAGLGIGGFLFSRYGRGWHPLLVYAVLEGLIGTLGSLSPRFFSLLDTVYIASYEMFSGAPLQLAIARAFFASLFLLPPTILMGGTLPVLVRWFTGDRLESGDVVSKLYASNTFGATAGVALAGFYAIPLVGLLTTLSFAVLLNFLLAVSSLVVAQGARRKDEQAEGPDDDDGSASEVPTGSTVVPGGARAILAVSCLMGFTSIADEVFWTRILVLHLGSSVYAYSLMLFAFLIGLAAGSAAVANVIEKIDLRRLLAFIEVALAAVLAIQVHLFVSMPDILEWFGTVVGVATYQQRQLAFLGASLVLILPPTMLMGATFPVVVKLFARARHEDESHSVGIVYFWNTVGSILGSLGAGFILVRALGSQNGLYLMAGINLLVGLYFWMQVENRKQIFWAPAGAAVALVLSMFTASPDQVILSAGIFVDEGAPIKLFREDVTATVTLREMKSGYLSLELNGVNVAGTAGDLIGTQKLQGHLPLLMHPDPKKVLHIGFGSGGTAYAVSLHPVEEILIAEISPEVLEVSDEYLRSENHGVLEDPRVRTVINDGRNLVLATPEKFDVILSDSIHPRYAGNGSLYTLDYFELCRKRLNPDGVISMWLPTYSLTTRNYLMILKAFSEVFPNSSVWYVPNVPNAFTIVIGRIEEGPIPLDRVLKNVTPEVAQDLRQVDVDNVYDIASSLILDGEGIAALTANVPPHIDDLPAVEYESGRLVDREFWWIRNFDVITRSASPLQRGFGGANAADLQNAERVRNQRTRAHLEVLIRTFMPQVADQLYPPQLPPAADASAPPVPQEEE